MSSHWFTVLPVAGHAAREFFEPALDEKQAAGFGRSTMQPGRCFADIVPDIEVLLDHLICRHPADGRARPGPNLLPLMTHPCAARWR